MLISYEKCFVCGNIAKFSINEDYVLYRDAICNFCGASIRNSDVAKTIAQYCLKETVDITEGFNKLEKIKILEAQNSGPINTVMKNSKNYIGFEFFDDVECGKYKNGTLCNNLEKLTFKDETFDLIISQDVFEHIKNPEKAFKEISRVLKVGGVHIFTIPLHEGRKTKNRKNLKPVYHLDGIREQGALVYTDWGDDISEYIDIYKMKTVRNDLHIFYNKSDITDVDKTYEKYLTTEALKYYKYNSIVFVSRKYNKTWIKDFIDRMTNK